MKVVNTLEGKALLLDEREISVIICALEEHGDAEAGRRFWRKAREENPDCVGVLRAEADQVLSLFCGCAYSILEGKGGRPAATGDS